jgi:hypothetical protein
MPYNTRKSIGSTQQKFEQYHLVSFPCDETYGYFKINVCRASKEDPKMVKINYKGKIYDAVVLFTGVKNKVKEEALLKHIDVSCSSDDEGAHDSVEVNKDCLIDDYSSQLLSNDLFSPPTQRRSLLEATTPKTTTKQSNAFKTPIRYSNMTNSENSKQQQKKSSASQRTPTSTQKQQSNEQSETPRGTKRPLDDNVSLLERIEQMDRRHKRETQRLHKKFEEVEIQKRQFPTSMIYNGVDLIEDFYGKSPELYALEIAPVIFGKIDLANGVITKDGKPTVNSHRKPLPLDQVKVLQEAVIAKFELTKSKFLLKWSTIKRKINSKGRGIAFTLKNAAKESTQKEAAQLRDAIGNDEYEENVDDIENNINQCSDEGSEDEENEDEYRADYK